MPVPNVNKYKPFTGNPARMRQLFLETYGQVKEIVGYWLKLGYDPEDIKAIMVKAVEAQIKEQA